MKKERGSQFPEDFILTTEMEAYARKKGVDDPGMEWLKFEAYHKARGTTFKSWPQAWRGWCLNCANFKPKGTVLNEDEYAKKMKAWREKSRRDTIAANERMKGLETG